MPDNAQGRTAVHPYGPSSNKEDKKKRAMPIMALRVVIVTTYLDYYTA